MERNARLPIARRLGAPLLAVALAACGSGPAPATATVMRVPVGTSPVRGPADAWVTVVEFSDFQCPYCAQAHATLATVLPEFGSDVRLVYKHFPLSFHARARPTAVASVCAQAQGLFWPFHDLVFARWAALMNGPDFEGTLAQVAADAGVEPTAWRACRADPASDAVVSADAALGSRMGVTATPTFAVNGVPIVGAAPAADFRAAIEAARTAARASGVPAAQYYDRVVLGQ